MSGGEAPDAVCKPQCGEGCESSSTSTTGTHANAALHLKTSSSAVRRQTMRIGEKGREPAAPEAPERLLCLRCATPYGATIAPGVMRNM